MRSEDPHIQSLVECKFASDQDEHVGSMRVLAAFYSRKFCSEENRLDAWYDWVRAGIKQIATQVESATMTIMIR